jgi:hypothetical protein
MPNGRCRVHGGKSTGPRTEAGIAAIRADHWKHGRYPKATIQHDARRERSSGKFGSWATSWTAFLGNWPPARQRKPVPSGARATGNFPEASPDDDFWTGG